MCLFDYSTLHEYSSHLVMVLTIASTSSSDGGFLAPGGNTKLIGSNKRDRERCRYAVSNACIDCFSASSALKNMKQSVHDLCMYLFLCPTQEILVKKYSGNGCNTEWHRWPPRLLREFKYSPVIL